MNKKALIIGELDNDKIFSLEKSAELGKLLDLDLSIVGFVDQESDAEAKKTALTAQASEIFAESVPVDVFVTNDIPKKVESLYLENKFDFIIKTGNRTESLFYTPLDWQLIRNTTCPLLILTEQKWNSKSNILATLDLDTNDKDQMALNKKVVKWAKYWAEKSKQQLQSCYVATVNRVLRELEVVEDKMPDADEIIELQAAYARLMGSEHLGDDDLHVCAGVPHKKIPSYANETKASLVVVGSVARTGVKGLLLGNTAEKILHHLRTDILILRP